MSMADESKKDLWQVGRRRQQLLQEIGELEEELDRARAQDRHIMKKDEIRWQERGSEIGMRIEGHRSAPLVNPMLGFNVYNLNSFISQSPPHSEPGAYHMHGEAVKYYLSGRGVEIIGGKRYEVEAGDVCFIPGHTWHGTQNPYHHPLPFLALT